MTRNGALTIAVLVALIAAAYFLLPSNRPKTIAYNEISTEKIQAARENMQAANTAGDTAKTIAATPATIEPGAPVRVFDKKTLKQFLEKDIHELAAASDIPKARHTDFKPLKKPVTLKLGTTSKTVAVHPYEISFETDENAAARLLHALTESNLHVISVHADAGNYTRKSNVRILLYLYVEEGR